MLCGDQNKTGATQNQEQLTLFSLKTDTSS